MDDPKYSGRLCRDENEAEQLKVLDHFELFSDSSDNFYDRDDIYYHLFIFEKIKDPVRQLGTNRARCTEMPGICYTYALAQRTKDFRAL